MWCRFRQTVWFYRGEDTGGELNQPVYVIEEPGGELSSAQQAVEGSAVGSEQPGEANRAVVIEGPGGELSSATVAPN